MSPNQQIKERRLELGLTENEVAARLAISVSAYADIEDYDHELLDQVSVARANRLCSILGIDICRLLGASEEEKGGHVPDENRSTLIRSAREHLNMSVEEVARKTGFNAKVIESIERGDPSIDDQCPVRLMLDLASILRLPPCRLVTRERPRS